MFRTRKQQTESKIKIHIGKWTNKQQHKAAELLNSKTNHWSKDRKKVFLLLLCLAFGAAITTILATSQPRPTVSHIRMPIRMDSIHKSLH